MGSSKDLTSVRITYYVKQAQYTEPKEDRIVLA